MITFLIIHLLLSSSAFFIGKSKINKQERFCHIVLAFTLPVVGLITVLILNYMKKEIIKEIDNTDEIIEEPPLFFYKPGEIRKTDIIPLEDALLMNDTAIKRKQLLNIAKDDILPFIDSLHLALEDEDSETSHYAATAITNIKKKLDVELQKKEVEYEQDKDNLDYTKEYYSILDTYLRSKLMDFSERKIKLYTYIEILKKLIDNDAGDEYYTKIIDAFYESNSLNDVERYCLDFLEKYNNETAFLSCLKYYYITKNKERFDEVLAQLRSSAIKLSNGGINIIRFWLGGSQ